MLHMNGYTTGHKIEIILLVEAIHKLSVRIKSNRIKCSSGEGTRTTVLIKKDRIL